MMAVPSGATPTRIVHTELGEVVVRHGVGGHAEGESGGVVHRQPVHQHGVGQQEVDGDYLPHVGHDVPVGKHHAHVPLHTAHPGQEAAYL